MATARYFLFVCLVGVTVITVNAQNTATTEAASEKLNSTMPSSDNNMSTMEKAMAGQETSVAVVVGIVCGVVLLIGLVVVILTIWIRRKRQRDIEFERAAKVQRSSANTAGVYVDLATDTPIVKKPISVTECTEMEKLRKDEDDEIA